MTEGEDVAGKKPGTKLMNIGSWIAAIGVAFGILAVVALKPPGLGLLILVIGGLVALIGYLQRVLLALERNGTAND
ncbi:hypothetical protein [Arthrobacter sp. JSM 101049]|uniref:hypothetical protein n=1 Tax=Arthrobacter sp. JSM 101049 TaxID=929097 RepID=UPI003564287D